MPCETDFLPGFPDGIHLSNQHSSGATRVSGDWGNSGVFPAAKTQPIVFFRPGHQPTMMQILNTHLPALNSSTLKRVTRALQSTSPRVQLINHAHRVTFELGGDWSPKPHPLRLQKILRLLFSGRPLQVSCCRYENKSGQTSSEGG